MADVAAAERATGYVAGGISPSARSAPTRPCSTPRRSRTPTIFVSAGRRGLDLEIAPADLVRGHRGDHAPIGALRSDPRRSSAVSRPACAVPSSSTQPLMPKAGSGARLSRTSPGRRPASVREPVVAGVEVDEEHAGVVGVADDVAEGVGVTEVAVLEELVAVVVVGPDDDGVAVGRLPRTARRPPARPRSRSLSRTAWISSGSP